MSQKLKIIGGAVLLLGVFAFGRWSAPEKVKTEVQTVYVDHKTEDKDEHKHTETTVTEKPDGTKETHIVEQDDTKTKDSESVVKTSDSVKEVTRSSSKVSISALGGNKIGSGENVFGAMISKPILGPITVGVWGLTNATVGASIGLTF